MLRLGPFDVGRVRHFSIDAAAIVRAPAPLASGGAFATKFGYRSVWYRNRHLRSTAQPGSETKPEHIQHIIFAAARETYTHHNNKVNEQSQSYK